MISHRLGILVGLALTVMFIVGGSAVVAGGELFGGSGILSLGVSFALIGVALLVPQRRAVSLTRDVVRIGDAAQTGLTYRNDRWRKAALTVGGAAAAYACVWMVFDGENGVEKTIGASGSAMLGLVTIDRVKSLRQWDVAILSDGLAIRSPWGIALAPWIAIHCAHPYEMNRHVWNVGIVADLDRIVAGRVHRVIMRTDRRLAGTSFSVEMFSRRSAEALAQAVTRCLNNRDETNRVPVLCPALLRGIPGLTTDTDQSH